MIDLPKVSNYTLPYSDFKLADTIDPDQFDSNNASIGSKLTELINESNDQDNRITSVENATVGLIHGVPSGTAFPTTPIPQGGDVFYRTDLDAFYVYNNNTKVWVQYAHQSDLTSHTGSTNNPHNVTASQVGAYTTSAVDTKVTNLDAMPYGFINSSSSVNYPTLNVWQTLTYASSEFIGSSDVVSNGTNTLTINTDGVYDMQAEMEISGLNSGVFSNILIRVIPPTGHGSAYDYSINRVGGSGYGGNGGGVWLSTGKIDKLWAGTQVYCMANIGESPRTIMHYRFRIHKIAKFNTGA